MEFWDRIEIIWNGSRLLAWILVLAASGLALWASVRPQSPGISIGLLALAAGIMSVRPQMHPAEKFAWIAVLVAFAILEVNAIGRSDRQNEDLRDGQNKKFDLIADGLKAAITQSQDQFRETMAGVGKVFDKTKQAADTATEAVNTITGGNGWAYIDMDTTLVNGHVTDTLQVELHVINTKVLRNVQLHIVDYKAFQADPTPVDPRTVLERDAVNTLMGDLRGLVQVFQPIGIDTKKKECDYFITFFALNGTWREELHYKKTGDTLQHAYRVVWQDFPANGSAVGMKERLLREDVSGDYPRDHGQVKWEVPIRR